MELIFPKVAIGIVKTREHLVADAIKSAERQLYPEDIDIVVIDNLDKKKSIGKCYNEIAEKTEADWIMYLGDDDIIVPTYIITLIARLLELSVDDKYNVVCLTTYCILYNDKSNKQLNRVVQGMWNRKYVLENRYDETLDKLVDIDLFRRTNEREDLTIALVPYMNGYYYGQGTDNISGNKFDGKVEIGVYGHKRTGNHYLIELLDLNFIKSHNPLAYSGGHGIPKELESKRKYLYVKRNKEDTLKSLFRYRDKQGLEAKSYDDFLSSKYKDMFNQNIKTDNEFHSLYKSDEMIIKRTGATKNITGHFSGIDMTPPEYYDKHVSEWEKLSIINDNVLIVNYEDLLNDFNNTMDVIADFLEYEKGEYQDIKERVGYFPKGESWER